MDISAIVLAGGQGARLGYQDKAWVNYLDKPLILHVMDVIEPQVDSVVISRNRENARYAALGFPCVSDDDSRGPLSGIAACLDHIRSDAVLVVPCDIPNLPGDLVAAMRPYLSEGTEVVMAKDADRLQHLVFLARLDCLKTIPAYLESGRRSVIGWLETRDVVTHDFQSSFLNINEVGDLQ